MDTVSDMEDDILNTIEVLTARVKTKEDEANKLKKLVNELCSEAGVQIRYPAIPQSGSTTTIRADHFYGQSLTAAIRNYLEIRKAGGLGAVSVPEIFKAIKGGGYKFGSKNEETARIVVGNALRKTSSIFHRLPNGQYGLLSWYPSARAPENDDAQGKKRPGKKKVAKTKETTEAGTNNDVTNKEVREVILAQAGNFQGTDIEKAVREKYPAKTIPAAKISTVLFLLKGKGLLKVITERSGKTGATFCKA